MILVFRMLIPFTATFTLWTSVKAFARSLVISKHPSGAEKGNLHDRLVTMDSVHVVARLNVEESNRWEGVRLQYEAIRTLAEMINAIFGGFITCSLANYMFYFAVAFFRISDEVSLAIVAINFTCYIILLYFSADICHQVIHNTYYLFHSLLTSTKSRDNHAKSSSKYYKTWNYSTF